MPLVEIALRVSGEWRIIAAGRPADMIAFEDEFGIPGPDPESGKMWRQVSWLAHRLSAPEVPFAEWVESVEDIAADPDGLATARAAIAEAEGRPLPAPPEANGAAAGAEDADPFGRVATGAGG